jgi:uncharacterized NAD-dependent epimerase/dehydratase family protein
MNVISGLHDFVGDDPEFAAAAKASGSHIYDVRKNTEKTIARRVGLRGDCLRVHAVGHDCSIGKMVVSIEVTNGLKKRGHDAKFIATGQTGIMVEGDGLPIDCIVGFPGRAAEKLSSRTSTTTSVIEGQGSLSTVLFGVTLSLLHGHPAALLVLRTGRRCHGVESVQIPPLAEIKRIYDVMSNIHQPCKIIGIGINSRKLSPAAAAEERERTRAAFGLPTCDVFRDGPDELVEAVLAFKQAGGWESP